MTFAADPSFGSSQLERQQQTEPSWAPALRIACATAAGRRNGDISAVSVTVTLTGTLADARALVAFSQALASQHGLCADLQSFAPPTFTVRFSRGGISAPRKRS